MGLVWFGEYLLSFAWLVSVFVHTVSASVVCSPTELVLVPSGVLFSYEPFVANIPRRLATFHIRPL